MIINLYTIIMFIASFGQIFLFVIVWSNRKVRGGKTLAGFIAATAFWAFANGFEMAVTTQSLKVVWATISYVGVTTAPVLFFTFVFEYGQLNRYFNSNKLKFFWIIPLFTLLGAITNSLHGLLWSDFSMVGENLLTYSYGPLFWINVLYTYIILTSSIVLLLYTAFSHLTVYKNKIIYLFIAAFAPLFANVTYIIEIGPLQGYDLTPFSLFISCAALSWILLKFDFMGLIPIAHMAITKQMKSALMVLDSLNRIIEVNAQMKSILSETELKIGHQLKLIGSQYQKFITICTDNSYYESEIRISNQSDKYYTVQITEIFDNNNKLVGKLVLLHDITYRKKIEQELTQQNALLQDKIYEIEELHEKFNQYSLRDPITGLYNRKYLVESITKEIARAERELSTFGICMIDIDNFQHINDTLGIEAGDHILTDTSNKIQNKMRKTDYICRFGGDEMIILIAKISAENLIQKVESFRAMINEESYEIAGTTISCSVSAGLAFFPEDGKTFDQLVQKADIALNRAKKDGKNRLAVYDKSMEQW
jgi:diguanylate cyclase (GGDEF)-like protein